MDPKIATIRARVVAEKNKTGNPGGTYPMLTKRDLITRTNLGSGQEPSNKQRRNFIGGVLTVLAASPLLVSPRPVMAKEARPPDDPFILLLAGVYQPVANGPNLGLSAVNLKDGSYSVTKIYPIFGIDDEGGGPNQEKAIGNFYVQFNGNLCAYQLPGGALAMSFNSVPAGAPPGFNGFVPFSDGKGGQYLEGTFELQILQATGIYQAFQGGHNHMVDRLHQLANGQFDEFCFCNISQYQFP
jgi:hypothetical protein